MTKHEITVSPSPLSPQTMTNLTGCWETVKLAGKTRENFPEKLLFFWMLLYIVLILLSISRIYQAYVNMTPSSWILDKEI